MRNLNIINPNPAAIKIFVPLFKYGRKPHGIHINVFERFDAWSFNMQNDLFDQVSMMNELFDGLCRKNGLRRRFITAMECEVPEHDPMTEFNYAHNGAICCGDFFTLEVIYYLLSTVFIPHWKEAADQISAFDRGRGWGDTSKRAIKALGKWKEFDKAELDDFYWEKQSRVKSHSHHMRASNKRRRTNEQ